MKPAPLSSKEPFATKDLTWNLTHLYHGDDDPKIAQDLKEVENAIIVFSNKWKKRQDYLKDPAMMKIALDEYEKLMANYGTSGNVGFYWGLRACQDEDDTKIKAQVNIIDEKSVSLLNAIEFFELRIGKIAKSSQSAFLTSKLLYAYRHFLERLFKTARYQLSEVEEKIMNVKMKTSYTNWVDMTSRFLSRETRILAGEDGKRKRLSFSQIQDLLDSPKKSVREVAAKNFNSILASHVDVAEAEMNSILENKKYNFQLRGYTQVDMARHVTDDIDSAVVETLIHAVSTRFDISRRYYDLKAQLLGQKDLAYAERNIRFGNLDQEISFPKACQMVDEVLKSIEPRFSDILQKFRRLGIYDVYPRKGKSSGAFCAYDLKISPTYILLNYTNRLTDCCTLAHETGHGISDELMKQTQNALNIGSPKCIAEVSSTFFEDFVLQRLLDEADDESKLAIYMQKLNDEVGSVFRQVAAYSFEKDLHESFNVKGYLSKHEIGELFLTHMNSYMGKSVRQDPGTENWWVHWGHFRSFFYVYSYASGLLISKYLQRIVRDNPKNVSKVITLLSTGTSQSPQDMFAAIGIDITKRSFWDASIDESEKLLTETEALAKKLKKI